MLDFHTKSVIALDQISLAGRIFKELPPPLIWKKTSRFFFNEPFPKLLSKMWIIFFLEFWQKRYILRMLFSSFPHKLSKNNNPTDWTRRWSIWTGKTYFNISGWVEIVLINDSNPVNLYFPRKIFFSLIWGIKSFSTYVCMSWCNIV